MASTKLFLTLAFLAIGSIHITSADGNAPADCVTPNNDCNNQPEITQANTDRTNCYFKCGYCRSWDNNGTCNDTSYNPSCNTDCDGIYNNSVGGQKLAECQTTYKQCMKDNPSCAAGYQVCVNKIADAIQNASQGLSDCNSGCWNNFCNNTGVNGTYNYQCYQFTNYTDCTTTCQANYNGTQAVQAQYACSAVQNKCNFGCTIASDRCTCACDDKFPEDQGGNTKCKVTCQNQLSTCSWIQDYGYPIPYYGGGIE